MTDENTNETHPTMEQSLHSIALSMININDELQQARRIQKETLRFQKAEARQVVIKPIPAYREETSLWRWLTGWATS